MSLAGLRYELAPAPSRQRPVLLLLGYGLMALVLWVAAPPLLWWRSITLLLLVGAGWRHWRCPPLPVSRVWFDGQGRLSWLHEEEGRLRPDSLVTPWCCLLHVQAPPPYGGWWAIYRDQLAERDFRRLARTLIRVRRQRQATTALE